ncbi:MAG: branched-chain amino acid ABC transporter permease [Dehalococcoidia bacterium]|nr:branched-chain amino acid ABC transporter permease [Dehalococcoidia bacterium]
MHQTAHYRDGVERFVPSPSEAVLLAALVLFCWKLYGGTENDAVAGLSSVVVVVVAWVVGVSLRAALNDMRWWLLLGFLVALIVPWLGANTFQVGVMSQVCVFALLIFGLNVVTGYTGQISLGHGALVGISAYIIAILSSNYGWNVFAAMTVGISVTTAFGFVLGIPALRLAGPYLAIATLAAALIFPPLLKLDTFEDYTGGIQGLHETRLSPPGPIESFLKEHAPSDAYQNDFQRRKFAEESYLYYISLAAGVVGLVTLWNLGRSRFGRAFVAVRDSEVAATSMGINVPLYKVTAFGISALYAGFAGAAFFLVIAFVAPESFDLVNLSINPLAYLVIGGLATTGGPVVGAFGYMWVPRVINKIATVSGDFDKLQGAMTGLLLIVVMTRLPQGVWGGVRRVNALSWQRLAGDSWAWAFQRSPLFWAGLALAAVVVVLIAQFIGTVWAVFALALLIVAPHDVWSGAGDVLRRLNPGWKRNASIQADVT